MARCDGWRPIRGRVRKIEIFRWFKRISEGESHPHGPCTFLLMIWGVRGVYSSYGGQMLFQSQQKIFQHF